MTLGKASILLTQKTPGGYRVASYILLQHLLTESKGGRRDRLQLTDPQRDEAALP